MDGDHKDSDANESVIKQLVSEVQALKNEVSTSSKAMKDLNSSLMSEVQALKYQLSAMSESNECVRKEMSEMNSSMAIEVQALKSQIVQAAENNIKQQNEMLEFNSSLMDEIQGLKYQISVMSKGNQQQQQQQEKQLQQQEEELQQQQQQQNPGNLPEFSDTRPNRFAKSSLLSTKEKMEISGEVQSKVFGDGPVRTTVRFRNFHVLPVSLIGMANTIGEIKTPIAGQYRFDVRTKLEECGVEKADVYICCVRKEDYFGEGDWKSSDDDDDNDDEEVDDVDVDDPEDKAEIIAMRKEAAKQRKEKLCKEKTKRHFLFTICVDKKKEIQRIHEASVSMVCEKDLIFWTEYDILEGTSTRGFWSRRSFCMLAGCFVF